MIASLIRERLPWMLVVLLTISVLCFVLSDLDPADPATLLLQAQGLETITEADLAAKREELRLDEPLFLRYFGWLSDAIHGDLGHSYRTYTPVLDLYLNRLPNTLLLAILATVVSFLISLPLGILAAFFHRSWVDRVIQFFVILVAAIPGFWLAFMLIVLFAVTLRWLPAFGTPTPAGVILPVTVLALQKTAVLTRLARSAALDALGQPWMHMANAKGVPPFRRAFHHLLPAVLGPMLPVSGLEFANLMTGAAVVEYVFAWPGIGKLAIDSVIGADMPVVVGFCLFAGLTFVVVNLLIDVITLIVDPRLRNP
ncbi:ABC transporter permease [Rhizobium laguerreae]|uniref:ABC transporter permease n=1 Tax=Rhizobium laguerreae TaxID=1076926 RepID=UPI001C900E61|nr:ABC transporter permease [Rhizobium laguerreae]MBY3093557.1 ABC transporter permease [Rhizobium laguerreae]MBY3109108.1 ABC transporter permease [Rhizobium laguerreae]MBY3143462.1 ABC transporter permease [Rhizobium laguerreae]MBY3163715.1 ABC transporter permease [Rhizobium laguerreae]MBY3266584.1 ABC transporter permease [Rhizobium laguerreae]